MQIILQLFGKFLPSSHIHYFGHLNWWDLVADAQKPKKELILSLHSNLNETGIGYCPKPKYTNLLTQSIKFDDYPCKSKKFLTQPMFL